MNSLFCFSDNIWIYPHFWETVLPDTGFLVHSTFYPLQHFEYNNPPPSNFQGLWWEIFWISYRGILCMWWDVMRYFSLAAFNIISLSLAFFSWYILCLVVGFLEFNLFEFHWPFGYLHSYLQIWDAGPLFLEVIFLPPSVSFLLWYFTMHRLVHLMMS